MVFSDVMRGYLMCEKHDTFEAPEDENQIIWRYMDFSKFVSLLDKKALYFSRLDKLSDSFEGSLPEENVKARDIRLEKLRQEDWNMDVQAEIALSEPACYKAMRKYNLVDCWHMNDRESAAMWKLYLKSDEGIAVQSTYKRLKESFHSNSKYPVRIEDTVRIGKVKYIDYSVDSMPLDNHFRPALHKRKSFEYEKELRAVVFRYEHDTNRDENGAYLEVDLDILIEKIYVAPTTPTWFHELVQSIAKKYGLKVKVEKSKLDGEALF
jgi:hypothetical protein